MRIEMSPVGRNHASAHLLVSLIVGWFAALKQIPMLGLDNCTYRKLGLQECQPDLSYYLGAKVAQIPAGTSVVDLDQIPIPNLVIEVSSTTLLDDLGIKRSLYEDLQVAEYWVIDVEADQIHAFRVGESGSSRITVSEILPHLQIALLEQALHLSRSMDQSQVLNWIVQQI
jgi:Uma2 family endonuclease